MYLWGTQFTLSGPVMEGFCSSLITAPVPISLLLPPLPISPQPPTLPSRLHHLQGCPRHFTPIPSSPRPCLHCLLHSEGGGSHLSPARLSQFHLHNPDPGPPTCFWILPLPISTFLWKPGRRGSCSYSQGRCLRQRFNLTVNAASALLCWLLKGGCRVGWAL